MNPIVEALLALPGPREYAGVGAVDTPAHVLPVMTEIAEQLCLRGFWLNSGGAPGADSAFEAGAGERKRIWRPHHATPEALELAERYHPAWWRVRGGGRRLIARNGFQVLGADLRSPVRAVICWTQGGRVIGGTGQALRIAADHSIPVFNLGSAQWSYLAARQPRLEGL